MRERRSREGVRERDELGRAQGFGANAGGPTDALESGDRPVPIHEAGQLQRVGERLTAVGEGSFNHSLHARVVRRQPDAAEGDECGVDARARSKDVGWHRMKPRALRDELDEHRHGAVGLRRGPGEEAVRDFALDHHAPELDAGQAVEALDHDRRGDVVGQIGNELPWSGAELREVERERVAEAELDVAAAAQLFLEPGLQCQVDLDRMDARDSLGEVRGQHAEPGTDLEHDVVGAQLRETPDYAQNVGIDQKMLAELFVGSDPPQRGENAASALRSIWAPSSSGSSLRASARAATVYTTFAGSLGLPRRGWGAR